MSEPSAHLPLHDDAQARVRYMIAGRPWRTLHMDEGIAQLWGRSRSELYRDARLWIEGIHEDDRPRLLEAWSGDPYQRWDLVYRVVRPDGRVRRVRDQGFRLPSRTHEVQVGGRITEVTAQYELEARLRFHSQLLDAVEQSVIATNEQGLVTFWSRASERLYGWTAEEALGQPVYELLGILPASGEFDAHRRDGVRIAVETRASPVFDGGVEVVGQIVISSDISERKRAERRVRESEERFRAIFAGAGIGIAIGDLEPAIIMANQAMAEFLGGAPEQLVGRDLRSLTHPGDWEAEQAEFERLVRGEIDRFVMEKRYRRLDGALAWGRLTATLVRSDIGRPLYSVGMVEDIGERRRAVAQVRSSREELRGLYSHLQVVREKEQARIARDLHDQLGQVLTALKLDVASLRKRAAVGNGAGMAQRLEQTAQIVDETLSATRDIAMQLRPVALDDLGLEAALEGLMDQMGRRAGFEWTLDARLEDLPLDLDRDTAAYRIVQEALTNVARHAAAKRVEVRAVHKNGELQLSVSDDGRGITAAATRASGSMGIAGMRERARAFGGGLAVRRRAGGGTRVTARLPDAPRH